MPTFPWPPQRKTPDTSALSLPDSQDTVKSPTGSLGGCGATLAQRGAEQRRRRMQEALRWRKAADLHVEYERRD